MKNALIGFSGFVGSTLLKQASFNTLYRSTTISDIRGGHFDTVVCAAAPAQKWIANREPVAPSACAGRPRTVRRREVRGGRVGGV